MLTMIGFVTFCTPLVMSMQEAQEDRSGRPASAPIPIAPQSYSPRGISAASSSSPKCTDLGNGRFIIEGVDPSHTEPDPHHEESSSYGASFYERARRAASKTWNPNGYAKSHKTSFFNNGDRLSQEATSLEELKSLTYLSPEAASQLQGRSREFQSLIREGDDLSRKFAARLPDAIALILANPMDAEAETLGDNVIASLMLMYAQVRAMRKAKLEESKKAGLKIPIGTPRKNVEDLLRDLSQYKAFIPNPDQHESF